MLCSVEQRAQRRAWRGAVLGWTSPQISGRRFLPEICVKKDRSIPLNLVLAGWFAFKRLQKSGGLGGRNALSALRTQRKVVNPQAGRICGSFLEKIFSENVLMVLRFTGLGVNSQENMPALQAKPIDKSTNKSTEKSAGNPPQNPAQSLKAISLQCGFWP